MKRWLLAVGILLIPFPLLASGWTDTDLALEAGYLTLHAVDWGQTLDIVELHKVYHERNPFLGAHPTREQVNTYFALTAIAHLAIAHWLDAPARSYFQAITIGVEAAAAGNNYRIGLRTDF